MNCIKSERARLNLTQSELGEKLGVDETTIRRWEKGTTQIPSGRATQMSELFQCSIDYLFGRTNERISTTVK